MPDIVLSTLRVIVHPNEKPVGYVGTGDENRGTGGKELANALELEKCGARNQTHK